MQFTLSAIVLGLAATVAALPPPSAGGIGAGNGIANKGNTNVRFPVPENMTVKQAQAKCGDQAQLSCCNKATYAGDTTDVNSGMLGGTLSNLIGSGSGADGLGLFDQCSKLDLQIPILIAVPIQDLINQKCKQNIACCQNSPSSAVSIFPPISMSLHLTKTELRSRWPWPPLCCPWLHHLSAFLCYLASCKKQWSPCQPSGLCSCRVRHERRCGLLSISGMESRLLAFVRLVRCPVRVPSVYH
jgi:hypothetical protein